MKQSKTCTRYDEHNKMLGICCCKNTVLESQISHFKNRKKVAASPDSVIDSSSSVTTDSGISKEDASEDVITEQPKKKVSGPGSSRASNWTLPESKLHNNINTSSYNVNNSSNVTTSNDSSRISSAASNFEIKQINQKILDPIDQKIIILDPPDILQNTRVIIETLTNYQTIFCYH